MKKMLLWLLFTGLTAAPFAQDQPAGKGMTRNDYLRKARTQSTIGWLLVGGGAICFILPATDDGNKNNSSSESTFNIELDLDGYFYATGAVLIGASIPFFIASSRNKERAASVSGFIQLEKVERETAILFNSPPAFPAAGICIRFH